MLQQKVCGWDMARVVIECLPLLCLEVLALGVDSLSAPVMGHAGQRL